MFCVGRTATRRQDRAFLTESEMKGAFMQLKRYSTVRVLGLCLFAALVSSFPLRAQDVTASVNGVVSDSTGATVAAAKVTAGDLDRGTTFSEIGRASCR